jgi:hypothetical protein
LRDADRRLYDPSDLAALLGAVTIGRQAFDASFQRPPNRFTFVNVRGEPGDADPAEYERRVVAFFDGALLRGR